MVHLAGNISWGHWPTLVPIAMTMHVLQQTKGHTLTNKRSHFAKQQCHIVS